MVPAVRARDADLQSLAISGVAVGLGDPGE